MKTNSLELVGPIRAAEKRSRLGFIVGTVVLGWFLGGAVAAESFLIDLSVTPADGTIYLGERQTHGGVALTAGDLDGNGIDEIIVGSPFAEYERGRIDIIYNPPLDQVPAFWDLTADPVGLDVATIFGTRKNDWAGYAVAVGDYNHDGWNDLAVGAPNMMDPVLRRPLAGAVYLFLGGYGGLLPGVRDVSAAQMVFLGAWENDGAGTGLTFGDLNGDGVDDLFMSAPFGNVKKTKRYIERAYVMYGSPDLLPGGIVDLNRHYDLLLLNATSRFYSAINSNACLIKDIVGDGIPDLIVGSRFNRDEYGYVHILRGAPRPRGLVLDVEEAADLVIRDERKGYGLGTALDAGDLDGDGDMDLVVGGPGGYSKGYGRILLLLFNGKLSRENQVRLLVGEPTPDLQWREIRGRNKRETLGQRIAVGDCDGDGIADIAAGCVYSRGVSDSKYGRGSVFYVPGRISWPEEPLGIDQVPDTIMISGATKKDQFGLALSLGNFGTGALTLLASAWQADGPGDSRKSSGELYLFSQLLLPVGVGPTALDPSGSGGSAAADLYFLSRSWMEPVQGAQERVDPSGDGVVGAEDVRKMDRRWRRPAAPR